MSDSELYDLNQENMFEEQDACIGENEPQGDQSIVLDLKGLEGLTFGTRWSNEGSDSQEKGAGKSSKVRRNFSDNKRNFSGGHDRHADRKESSSFRRSFTPRSQNRTFVPHFEVLFFPEDRSFDMLLDEMRRSCKTYEFFTVAKLILQKPERFAVMVRRRPNREGEILPVYLSLLDDIPFDSEREAMNYIVSHHLEEFFDVKEETVEPPKGRFTCIHRCGVTGKLLSAPNYHKYKTILMDHFNSEIRTMSLERFISKIETTKDENDIQAWIEQMSKKVTYFPKKISEEEISAEPLNSLEEVKNYLLAHFKDRILREVKTLRIAGPMCAQLPPSNLSRSVQYFLERQRNFPLDTANNLRSRFRRAGFGIYRKGKKGISYVCAVKRNFRKESDVFDSKTQSLIDFLELHPMIDRNALKEEYINALSLDTDEVMSILFKLIHEGYVVDYENGQLFLNPKLIEIEQPAKETSEESLNTSEKKPETKEIETEKQSSSMPEVIELGIQETAIEKLQDGSLLVQETSVTIEQPNH